MVLVAFLTPVVPLVLLAAVIIFLPSRWLGGLVFALVIGTIVRMVAYEKQRSRLPPGRVLTERDDPELFAILSRLCALADLPMPEVLLSGQSPPNSWVVHYPRRKPRLYVTSGLRPLLTPTELQAVLGHELAHIANRDALVMSVVGLPGSVMMRVRGAGGPDALLVLAIGALSQLGTTILSRYRELTADIGSCAITGHPSALASALLKVSDSLDQIQIPRKDLRAAAALNSFNLVAVQSSRGWWRRNGVLNRITTTHPPIRKRLHALHALERAQQVRHPTYPAEL